MDATGDASSVDEKSGQVVAQGFQIINGAQTLGTLARSDPKGDLEVLFRLTKGLDVKSEKGFNRDIIQFNNTQNVIKVSDFRANDPIQARLAAEFERYASKPHIPRIRYVPKRTFNVSRVRRWCG
ncbi:MAG TPA: AIPR family protein [Polyangiaceae bacterium]|nr:AIPR family protein [Polyangiaceae bacterium]